MHLVPVHTGRLSGVLFCILFGLTTLSAQTVTLTTVHGRVTDTLNTPRPYASVQVDGEEIGVRTDIDGYFYFQSKKHPKFVKIAYVGYKSQKVKINPDVHNELEIKLLEETYGIQEVTIRPKKYRKKDNPAVDLIQEVFKHKDQNRKEGLDYYSFEKYEKLEFDLNNINDGFRKKWYLKRFRFIFNNVDTNDVNGKVALPFFFRERLLEVKYRKDPSTLKEYLVGENQTKLRDEYDVDNDGVSKYISNLYQDIDIYQPNIDLLSIQFVGPLSGIATSYYRFYITDTLEVNGEKFADVFFAPMNKSNLAFMGNMLVALDSTYAVRKVVMGVSKDINLNFVTDLRIEQEYDFFGEGSSRRLLLTTDAVTMDFNILKNAEGRSLLVHKTNSYRNYVLNQPIPDSLFSPPVPTLVKRPIQLTAEDWPDYRHQPLEIREVAIGKMMDSIQHSPTFRTVMTASNIAGTGFVKFGGLEMGPIATFASFNDIEGSRFRVGGRTNQKFIKPLQLSGYLAYGTLDRQWKYRAAATWSLSGELPRKFPMNNITVGYQRDIRPLGADISNWSPDNLLLSFQRGSNSRMAYQDVARVEYVREFQTGFSVNPFFYWKRFTPAGKLSFEYQAVGTPDFISQPDITTTEAGVILRFAPNEKFYQGTTYRFTMLTQKPVFTLTYRAGVSTIGGTYDYHKLVASFSKYFFLGPLGRSYVFAEAGRTFGTVPFPLLDIHRANQSYQYDWYSYNLMNFMEFASDKYFGLTLYNNFSGLLLNNIPVIKKLQWREVATLKLLWGGLDDKNRPTVDNGLLRFPLNDQGADYIHTLGSKPYVEASVGIANIFRVIRLDYLWRLSYTDLPNVDTWGIRFSFQAGF